MPKQAVAPIAKRFALNVRTTEELRSKLEAASQSSGRVLSHEVDARLQASFDVEDQNALQEEIKAEMRGTIAAMEQQIALDKKARDLLYPDDAARALGEAFAITLIAAQHQLGANWRESPSVAAVVAGVVREVMAKFSRPTGLLAGLAVDQRVPDAIRAITQSVNSHLDKVMPSLSEPELEADFSLWTHRARTVVVFREKTSGEVLEVVRGPEWDVTDPEDRPALGSDYRAAMDRFRSRRDTVETETFTAYSMKDGSAVWDSLSDPGKRIVLRPATPNEIAGMAEAPGQLPESIIGRALHDDAVSGLPLVQAEKAADAKQQDPAAAPPTKTRARSRPKISA